MAVKVVSLTASGSSTDGTSFSTASITPARGAIIAVAVVSTLATAPPQPTLSGNAFTYVATAADVSFDTIAAPTKRLTWFLGSGDNPTAGAILIDFGAITMTHCRWSVAQITGMPWRAGVAPEVIQAVTNRANAAPPTSITWTTLPRYRNLLLHAVSNGNNTEDYTVEAGWTQLGGTNRGASPAVQLVAAWNDQADETPTMTWTTGTNWGAAALEIAYAASSVDTADHALDVTLVG